MPKASHPVLARPSPTIDPRVIFAFGVAAIVVATVMAVVIPRPEPHQVRIFAVMTGLGGAGFMNVLTGGLEIEIKWVKAGGPPAVFVFIVWFFGAGAPTGILGHG